MPWTASPRGTVAQTTRPGGHRARLHRGPQGRHGVQSLREGAEESALFERQSEKQGRNLPTLEPGLRGLKSGVPL